MMNSAAALTLVSISCFIDPTRGLQQTLRCLENNISSLVRLSPLGQEVYGRHDSKHQNTPASSVLFGDCVHDRVYVQMPVTSDESMLGNLQSRRHGDALWSASLNTTFSTLVRSPCALPTVRDLSVHRASDSNSQLRSIPELMIRDCSHARFRPFASLPRRALRVTPPARATKRSIAAIQSPGVYNPGV